MMAIYKQQQILWAASTTIIQGCTFSYYQVHDAKTLLLCKRDKGEGARKKNNHICSLVTDVEQILLYNKLEKVEQKQN
mgnify:CR=1 FL=1